MQENGQFDYTILRGRILEIHGSLTAFANAMGISRQSLHNRLRNGTWDQKEIMKAIELLKINDLQFGVSLFFTKKNNF